MHKGVRENGGEGDQIVTSILLHVISYLNSALYKPYIRLYNYKFHMNI